MVRVARWQAREVVVRTGANLTWGLESDDTPQVLAQDAAYRFPAQHPEIHISNKNNIFNMLPLFNKSNMRYSCVSRKSWLSNVSYVR